MVHILSLAKKGLEFIEKLNMHANLRRKWIVKDEEETSANYGYFPQERPIKEYINLGVINLDKPPGPTSHEVVAWIKKLLSLERAGHGGTLELSTP